MTATTASPPDAFRAAAGRHAAGAAWCSATVRCSGDDDDPDWQLYEAIMDEYASGEIELANTLPSPAYQAFVPGVLDVAGHRSGGDHAGAAAARMGTHCPSSPCRSVVGGPSCATAHSSPSRPPSASSTALESHLDADAQLTDFVLVDMSAVLDATAEAMGG